MEEKTCPECQMAFACSPSPGANECWCHSYPSIMPTDAREQCRCPTCLAKAIGERIEQLDRDSDHQQMLALARQFRGPGELIEHIDYTIENNHYVFTRWYHLKRGSCCGSGCRHCPYGHEAVQREDGPQQTS